MDHEQLIETFYHSFANKDAETMISCYHDDIVFEDPAFGVLKGDDAKNMWRMLIARGSASTIIKHENAHTDENEGFANWTAEYEYGPKKRKVINHITAHFIFKEGKIIQHTDQFDLWKWTQQALGFSGYLLGWSAFMKKSIQKKTNGLLKKFSEEKNK